MNWGRMAEIMVELMRTPARQAREEREMVRLIPAQRKERV